MKATRLSKAAALSICLAFASISLSAPAAAESRVPTAFDMHEFDPVNFSGGSSNAFFDGSESGSDMSAGERPGLTFDMSEFEPFLFAGGNSNAFFDGSESGSDMAAGAVAPLVIGSSSTDM